MCKSKFEHFELYHLFFLLFRMPCQLGAHGIAPQIGSVFLLLVFYLTDFQLVEYIPKPAFSSMLVVSCIDMIYTWFYKSYFKTNDKFEWMVVPAIVLCAFVFDLLTAVFLGIAFSTFIFVGSFNRSGEFYTKMHSAHIFEVSSHFSQHSPFTGVVKYVANGAVIRSTIERPFRKGDWLSDNGDFIQIIVLQNYLFFGNASIVYNYIASMFLRSAGSDSTDSFACRKPKYLILVSETRSEPSEVVCAQAHSYTISSPGLAGHDVDYRHGYFDCRYFQ